MRLNTETFRLMLQLLTNKPINHTRNTFCRTRSLFNATFSFLITWRSSSSKSAAVYRISSKSDDFSLRCGDITIFRMAAVRHLGIVLPPYETSHAVSVGDRSCLSNFMSIWYTDVNGTVDQALSVSSSDIIKVSKKYMSIAKFRSKVKSI